MNRIAILAGLILAAAPALSQTGGVARVTVRLPRDARLYVDEVFCPLTGELRTFDTPPLDPDRKYSYTLTVEITHEMKPVRVKRQIIVQSNRTTDVDFGDRAAILAAARKEANREDRETGKTPDAPKGLPPIHAVASLKDGQVSIAVPRFKYVEKNEEYDYEEGGVKRKATRKIKVAVPVMEQMLFPLKKVQVLDVSGERITDERAAELLAKDRVVLLAESEKIDPFYFSTTKPGTLVIVTPPTQAPAPIPVPGTKQPAANRPTTPAPRLVNAVFQGGELIYEDVVIATKFVDVTETVTGPDGKPRQITVKKPVFESKLQKAKLDPSKCLLSTAAGKDLTPKDLERLLGDKPTAIVLSTTGLPVEPFHLQLYNADTLVVVPPAPIGPRVSEPGDPIKRVPPPQPKEENP